jgi:hypothetical protein
VDILNSLVGPTQVCIAQPNVGCQETFLVEQRQLITQPMIGVVPQIVTQQPRLFGMSIKINPRKISRYTLPRLD